MPARSRAGLFRPWWRKQPRIVSWSRLRGWAMTWKCVLRARHRDSAISILRAAYGERRGAIRIRSRDAEKLVVEYDSAIPVDRIAAEWIWNDRKHYGETGVTSSRGVATIRSFRMAWQEGGTWLSARPWGERSPGWRTSVELMHATRGRTVLIQFPQQFPAAAQAFIAVAVLPRDEHGDLAMLLALPAPVNGPAEVMIDRGPSRLHQAGNVRAVMLSGPGGTARRTPSSTVPFGMTFPAEDMRRIAPAGGLIRVSVETSASVADISSAEFELRVRSRQ